MSTARVSRNKWTLKLSAQRVTAVRSRNITLTGKTVRDSEHAHTGVSLRLTNLRKIGLQLERNNITIQRCLRQEIKISSLLSAKHVRSMIG